MLFINYRQQDIITFIKKAQEKAVATDSKIWVLLDEINTCDHLGLVAEMICHRTALGVPLHKNVAVLAACNPYPQTKLPFPLVLHKSGVF